VVPPAEPVATVLVVDDDAGLRTSLGWALRIEGFEVDTAPDGWAGMARVQEGDVGLLVLDAALPGLDGIEVTRRLRRDGHVLPVLILSARGGVDDRVRGLRAGADDYMVKPFAVRELVARLEALRRRAPPRGAVGPGDELCCADLRVDPRGRRATRAGRPLALTRREFDLLEMLVRNADLVLSRSQLLVGVWGYDSTADSNVVDVFVGYLRRKLEADGRPRLVHTVRGVGFVLRETG
jgi:two-component system response regulator PrrA